MASYLCYCVHFWKSKFSVPRASAKHKWNIKYNNFTSIQVHFIVINSLLARTLCVRVLKSKLALFSLQSWLEPNIWTSPLTRVKCLKNFDALSSRAITSFAHYTDETFPIYRVARSRGRCADARVAPNRLRYADWKWWLICFRWLSICVTDFGSLR